MNKISKYSDFFLEKEFDLIITELFRIFESEGKWLDERTVEWNFEKPESDSVFDKVKKFVDKLPVDKLKSYFIKLMNSIKSLPASLRKKLIIGYSSIFLAVVSLPHLVSPGVSVSGQLDPKIKQEILELNTKSSFKEAQELVKTAEAGYSDDRKDPGNWVDVTGGKRFVGTNHGISAPILAEYLRRLPKKEDMKKLSYQTAVKIFKKKYWEKQNLEKFNNQSVANIIYDGCVNQGISAMKDILTKALTQMGVKISPGVSPFSIKIIQKANQVDQQKLHDLIKELREKRYKEAASWKTHGSGWINRLQDLSYTPTQVKIDEVS